MITTQRKIENAEKALTIAIAKALDKEEYISADNMTTILHRLSQSSEQEYSHIQLQQLQNKVYAITGPGEIMALFNELMGIGAG